MERKPSAFFLVLAVLLLISPDRSPAQGGLDQAAPIDPFLNGLLPEKTPRTATGNWALVNAFPNLTFIDPVQMIPVPGTNQLMMVEKNGRLAVFENNPAANSKTVLFDISGQVESSHDSGMLGLAFHPDFGQAGSPNRDFLYVYYRYTPNASEKNLGYCRLSRFTWPLGASTIDTASEFVLINQYDRHNWHNGGGIFFGADGFLYVSIGDEGGSNDQYQSGQKKNLGLLAGVLRIDVDEDSSRSHPIRRQPLNPANPPAGWPNSYSQGYFVPDDNPWQSPGGSELEEFYAVGLRSPHRMTLDPVTNRIWLGDVGQGAREEISLVEKEANLQWPYREGDIAGPKAKPNPLIGFDQPPVWAYSRAFGGCVIGGYVYRGSAHPDLQGKYLFGDHNNGIIRAMTYIPGQVPQIEDLVTMASHGPGPKNGLGSFGIDANGEVYVLSLAGTNKDGGIVYKFEQTGSGTPEPPALLSQTGAFQDLASLTPNAGVVPYDLVQPLWSDGADKKRWIAIPNDGSPDSSDEQIGFTETGEWTFPVGTVLIKHFEIAGRRLETRLLVHGTDGIYYGVTYKWRPDNSEADLLPDPPLDETIDLGGGQSIDWHFPGRTECFTCHTAAAGTVLGPKTRHLNRDLFYPVTGRTANQITTLNQLGFISPAPDEADIPNFLTAANVNDLSETLDRRARSYLDINCSQCHRPGGPTQAVFDALLPTPPSLQNMVNIDPINDLGVTGAKIVKPQSPPESVLYLRVNSLDGCCAMPPLAKNAVDADAVQAIFDWINTLDPNQPPPGEPGLEYDYFEGQFTQLPNFSALDPDETGIVPNFDLRVRNRFNDYALRFLGSLHVPSPADYTLYLTSDDGSRLWLNGTLMIDHDGNHGATTMSATVNLAAGAHPLEVAYFQGGGGAALSVEIAGPGLARQVIPDGLLTHGGSGGGSGNQAPDLTPVPIQSTIVNQAANLSLTASDPENDTLTYSASGLPPGLSVNAATGAITGTPTAAAAYNVTATVSDGQGNSDSESFTWNVTTPGNQPPVLTAIPNQSTEINQAANLSVTASDPENDTLTFSAAGLPPGLSINAGTGAITGTPTSVAAYNVTVTVSDGQGNTDTESFSWNVTGPPGSAEPGLNYEYYEGQFSQIPNYSNLVPDQTGVAANISLSPRERWKNYSLRFLGNLNVPAAGGYTLHLTSDDGSRLWLGGALVIDHDGNHGATTMSATVNLGAGAHPLEVAYFQGGGGANLTIEIEGPGLTRQPIQDAFLTHGGGGGGGGNQPPNLAPIPNQLTEIDQPVNLSLAATDPEDDTLTFSAAGLPTGLSINPATGAITGSPATAAAFNVTVTVSDGQGNSDTQSFGWTVNDPGATTFPGLQYEYYEGTFTQLPNFSALTPVQTGVATNIDISPRLRWKDYALRFLGNLSITTAGDYTLYLTSDDGSRLWLGGDLVIDHDGNHGATTKSATVTLSVGNHPLEVAYFQGGGGASLSLEISGPGLSQQPIPDAFLNYGGTGGGSEAGNSGGSGNSQARSNPTSPSSGSDGSSLARIGTRFQPDNWIGSHLTSQRGDNIYNATGSSQTTTLKFKSLRTLSFYFTVQNDRRIPDALKVLASRKDRKFKLSYHQLTDGPRNITGQITAGGLVTEALPVEARLAFQVRAKPSQKLKNRRGLRRLSVLSTSTASGLDPDRVKAVLKKSK